MLLRTAVRLLAYKTSISITLFKYKRIKGVIIRVILLTLVLALVLTLLAVAIIASICEECLNS